MKVEHIGWIKTNNAVVVHMENVSILFSYGIPVAFQNRKIGRFYRMKEFHNAVTANHLNDWLRGHCVEEVTQEILNMMIENVDGS